ncbi:hypothetical protein HDV05_004958 [Chytridiales sp. JEL 0842]|nr:hypothetical protein HDV05_004958 [Chytridiales sp. JEL 0842]
MFLHEDELVVAFRDKAPAAREHILIVPRKHIRNCNHVRPTSEDIEIIERIQAVAEKLIKKCVDISVDCGSRPKKDELYRIGFTRPPWNTVDHLHCHALTLPLETNVIRGFFLRGSRFLLVDELLKRIK